MCIKYTNCNLSDLFSYFRINVPEILGQKLVIFSLLIVAYKTHLRHVSCLVKMYTWKSANNFIFFVETLFRMSGSRVEDHHTQFISLTTYNKQYSPQTLSILSSIIPNPFPQSSIFPNSNPVHEQHAKKKGEIGPF